MTDEALRLLLLAARRHRDRQKQVPTGISAPAGTIEPSNHLKSAQLTTDNSISASGRPE
jgi:hypothetical protein